MRNIPKIIHQVWDSPENRDIPLFLQVLMNTWKVYNPDWKYHLWNRKEMDRLVKEEFPYFCDTYYNFPYDIQRWDAIRYMILYKYGGLYVDLDIECLKPIDPILKNINLGIGEEASEKSLYPYLKHMLGNSFLVSVEGAEGWNFILSRIMNLKSAPELIENKESLTLTTTGSLMLSKIFDELNHKFDASPISYELVAPVNKYDVIRYIYKRERVQFEERIQSAYCVHYYLGTWSEKVAII